MKFGVADYGMSVWYGGSFDTEQRVRDLKALGFDGIERLEAIDTADLIYRAEIFRRQGMDFSTLRTSSDEVMIRWACALKCRYVWLQQYWDRVVSVDRCIRNYRFFVEAAARRGVPAVLHNHLGARFENQEEVDRYMTDCPEGGLLLDIGHLHAAGGDVVGTIRKYHERILAVHFKDYVIKDATVGLDKWNDRLYFCGLNKGNAGMELQPIVDALKAVGFHTSDRWALIEHDTHLQDPLIDLADSLAILKNAFGV